MKLREFINELNEINGDHPDAEIGTNKLSSEVIIFLNDADKDVIFMELKYDNKNK